MEFLALPFFFLFFRNTMRSLVWISKTKSWFFNSFSRIVKPKTEGWKVDFFLTNVKGRVCWENNEQRCCKCWITSSLTGGGNKILRPSISPKQWTHVELSKNHTWSPQVRRSFKRMKTDGQGWLKNTYEQWPNPLWTVGGNCKVHMVTPFSTTGLQITDLLRGA